MGGLVVVFGIRRCRREARTRNRTAPVHHGGGGFSSFPLQRVVMMLDKGRSRVSAARYCCGPLATVHCYVASSVNFFRPRIYHDHNTIYIHNLNLIFFSHEAQAPVKASQEPTGDGELQSPLSIPSLSAIVRVVSASPAACTFSAERAEAYLSPSRSLSPKPGSSCDFALHYCFLLCLSPEIN